MAFRILESLSSSNAPQPPVPWRDRSSGSSHATAYDLVPPDPMVDLVASASDLHPLVPFSLESIETPRPGTGKLIQPSVLTAQPSPGPTAPLRPASSTVADHEARQTGYLTGISLAGILQMLHMERNSCVLEVTADGRLGTLTMVNGELIDAESDGECGDAVAMEILHWPSPITAILPSAVLVRHSVNLPLTRLLMDSVRLQDEAIVLPEPAWTHGESSPSSAPAVPARWLDLPKRLVALGSHTALLMTVTSDAPVAEAGRGTDLASSAAAVARGVRTWTTLLVPGVDRVHVIAGVRRLVLASLTPDNDAFVYFEAPADMPLGAIWQAIAAAS